MEDINEETIEQCLVLAIQEFLNVNMGVVINIPNTNDKYIVWRSEDGMRLYKPYTDEEVEHLNQFDHGDIVDIGTEEEEK